MLKRNAYPILIASIAIIALLIIIFSKKPKDNSSLSFKERFGKSALSAEWIETKNAIQDLIKNIEINPYNNEFKLKLAQAYIQESRVTGDHAFYDEKSLELLDAILEKEPKNFDALCCKSSVLMSQHHFAEGLTIAKIALPINPNNSFIYGLMCDANVELGNYNEAVKMSDKMISIRPDIRSYSRVSYLREIHGETKGAIAAAKLAISSGYPGLEQTAWTRTILAHLYESTGILDSAEFQYRTALNERPNYAYAIAGLGKIEKAKGNYLEAIKYFEQANKLIIDYSFSEELIDLYDLTKNNNKKEKTIQEVINILSPIADVDEGKTGHGHYADKEISYIYIKAKQYDLALKHSQIEYNRRPDNIDACEALAWSYYYNKNYEKANFYINKALKTNAKYPTLLVRAGIIKIKLNKVDEGKAFINAGLTNNPFIDPKLKNEVQKVIGLT